jgi:hypothetical protein
MKPKIVIIVSLIALLFSCKKLYESKFVMKNIESNEINIQEAKLKEKTYQTELISAKNAGILHNKMLLEISKIKGFEKFMMREIKNICYERLAPKSYTNSNKKEFEFFDETYKFRKGTLENFVYLVVPNTAPWLLKIEDILKNDIQNKSILFKDMINEIELEKSLTKYDKIISIKIISIALNSNEFWIDAYSNTNNPYYKIVNKMKTPTNQFRDALNAIVLADAVGYAVAFQQCMNNSDASCLADPSCRTQREADCQNYGAWNSIAASHSISTSQ